MSLLVAGIPPYELNGSRLQKVGRRLLDGC